MNNVAVIGGSGFYDFTELGCETTQLVETPYSQSAISISQFDVDGTNVYYIPRHGQAHSCPPHKINYRANIDALARLGVEHIIAVNAVGGITSPMSPGVIALPDQIIDYSWGREHTFFDEFAQTMGHIDFSSPLESPLREFVLKQFQSQGVACVDAGVYGCTQGPRLETAAEIKRLKRDGCDLVGMTLMPEAALACEKNITYFSICVVCNWAAGITDGGMDASSAAAGLPALTIDEMKTVLDNKITQLKDALHAVFTLI